MYQPASEDQDRRAVDAGKMGAMRWARLRQGSKRLWSALRAATLGFAEHEGGFRSAALAYHALLSLFPLLLFLIYLGSGVLETEATRNALGEYLAGALPAASDTVEQIIEQTLQARGPIGLLGGIGLLWAASSLFISLSTTLNVIWGARPRPFWRLRLLGAVSVLIVGLLFVFSTTLSALATIPWAGKNTELWRWFNVGIVETATVVLFWLLYYWVPNCRVEPRAALFGAVVASAAWQIGRTGFAWYLASGLTDHGAVYGSLASIIALLLWAYISGLIVLWGAELAAALQRELWPGKGV